MSLKLLGYTRNAIRLSAESIASAILTGIVTG